MKKCIKCNENLNISNFSFRKDIQKHSNTCKACLSARCKVWFRNLEDNKKKERNFKSIKFRAAQRIEWRATNNPKYKILQKTQQFHDITRKWKQNTPAWADLEVIKQIFLNCPEGMSVDHIIPINGKEVCGLHVEYNLQYLSISENASKGNRLCHLQQESHLHQQE